MNTSTARQECATPIIFVHYVQNDRQTTTGRRRTDVVVY
ncbi:unnamed protein product [Ascophyllum nodosum]